MTSLRLVCVALSQDFQYKGRAIQTNMLSPVILTPPRTDRNPATSGHRPRAFAACSGELEEGRQTSPGVSGSRSAARLPACDCLHVRTHPQATAWAGCTAAVPGRNGQCLGRLYWYRGTGYISAPIPLGLALCFSRQRKKLLIPFHIVNIGRPSLTCPTLSHGWLGIREGPATDAAKARA